MRTIRFAAYGEPADVLHLDTIAVPKPGPGHIRVKVAACALNPADWALCRGLFAGDLPRGIGLDVSGTVDALGEGVTGFAIGDRVLGVPDYKDYPCAGASDFTVLDQWTSVPRGLSLNAAATLPMVVETASRSLDRLGDVAGRTLLVYGAGTMIGFAAVQIAMLRGARVIAAAGHTFADELRAIGAEVTSYGNEMEERVRAVTGNPPDLILDAGPISDVLPRLVGIADGDGSRIVTVSNHGPAAEALGVRDSFGPMRYDALAEYAEYAARGAFEVPIARTFELEDWRAALDVSLSGEAHGKLLLIP